MTLEAVAIAGPDRLDRFRLALQWRLAPREARRILELGAGRSLDQALQASSHMLRASVVDRISGMPTRAEASAVLERFEKQGISLLDAEDDGFPALLLMIPDPPFHLFVRGEYWRNTQASSDAAVDGPSRVRSHRIHVAIIGARAASSAGKEIARQLGRDLALAGAVVVSGLARGIDGAAHRGALEAGGVTIAVLGAAIDLPYPPEHKGLYDEILRAGGVASEFPPGAPPLPLHFPRRNRILSGLCDVVVVVEGSDRSGARSTVDHALDQGREVMAVPRDILLPGSALPNRLLSEGAAVARSARAILEQVGGGMVNIAPPRPGANGRGAAHPIESLGDGLPVEIWRTLRAGALRFEDLSATLAAAPAELQSALSELEVMGWIVRSSEGRYAAQG